MSKFKKFFAWLCSPFAKKPVLDVQKHREIAAAANTVLSIERSTERVAVKTSPGPNAKVFSAAELNARLRARKIEEQARSASVSRQTSQHYRNDSDDALFLAAMYSGPSSHSSSSSSSSSSRSSCDDGGSYSSGDSGGGGSCD